MIIQASSELENACESFDPSNARLRTMIDTRPAIAWCSPPDGSGEFWNGRWQDYTGLSVEAARDRARKNLIHPDDLEKKWRADGASGQAACVEDRLRRFDGEYRWFLFPYEPLRDESGKIVSWSGTNTDIEDLRQDRFRHNRSRAET